MSAECSIRRAGVTDFAAVLAIERECAETSHWSERMWRSILEQSDAIRSDASERNAIETLRVVFVAESLGDVVGFVVVQSAGGGAELESVAVRPEKRRRGVANALCREAMEWVASGAAGHGAGGESAAGMHLEVRAGNAAALRLYAALGFVEQGRRRGYYCDPVEDAVVMQRGLGMMVE